MYVNDDHGRLSYAATYFDSFGVKHIPKENRKFIGNKTSIIYIYRIQAYDLLMFRYFCNGFTDFMLKRKCLVGYTSLFSPDKYEKSDEIIVKYFQYLKKLT